MCFSFQVKYNTIYLGWFEFVYKPVLKVIFNIELNIMGERRKLVYLCIKINTQVFQLFEYIDLDKYFCRAETKMKPFSFYLLALVFFCFLFKNMPV